MPKLSANHGGQGASSREGGLRRTAPPTNKRVSPRNRPLTEPRRRALLDHLARVSAQLEALLAGQDLRIADLALPQARRPGETPLERLQRLRALLGAALARLDAGQPTLCEACATPLPAAELDALPWATRCRACPG